MTYFIYYASINLVGALIFGIMLMHDRMNIDRQEKQIKYDHALLAFHLYFISDAIWSGVDSEVFPVNKFTVLATNFSNFMIMTLVTYTWLRYVMAEEQIPHRNKKRFRIILSMPLLVSAVVLIVTYLISPEFLIDENYKTTTMFDLYLICVPNIYIIAVIIYAVRKARKEDNPIEKKKHLNIGFFPIMSVAGGVLQMVLMPELPVFCFASTILMLIFYIQSMEAQISTDALTKLNNRGQLIRYISQESNLWIEGRHTYILMMDINDFKKINDTYGHAEGDHALVILAGALMNVLRKYNMPIFLGRYGGDEFVMIVHPSEEKELDALIGDIRANITEKCEKDNLPYRMSVGIGVDELRKDETDAFAKSMKRADDNMYENKISVKKQHMVL